MKKGLRSQIAARYADGDGVKQSRDLNTVFQAMEDATADYTAGIFFAALYEAHRFGPKRAALVNEKLGDIGSREDSQGKENETRDFTEYWRHVLKQENVDTRKVQYIANVIMKLTTLGTKNRNIQRNIQEFADRVVIACLFILWRGFRFKEKRLLPVQNKMYDLAWLIDKKQMMVFEPMKFSAEKAGITFTTLKMCEEEHGEIFIGTKRQIKDWYKKHPEEAAEWRRLYERKENV